MNTEHQITWGDLPYAAYLMALEEGVDQCAIRNLETNRQEAHLFLLKDGLLAITEVNLPDDVQPDNGLLIAIGRVMVAHRRASKEGRSLT